MSFSNAFAFVASSQSGRSYRFDFSCWVRHNNRKPNNTPLPPKILPIFGAAQMRWTMKVIERLTAAEIQLRSPPRIGVAA